MKFNDILKKIAPSLKRAYEGSLYEHSGNQGVEREKALIDFLVKFMPQKYGFRSGEVFDEGGNNAGQIDIIIYDKLHSPVIEHGRDIISPVESTYGIISVKSQMGGRELNNAIEGIKKYNNLKRPKAEEGQYYLEPYTDIRAGNGMKFHSSYQQNINCIFAYDTTYKKPETILKKMKNAGCIDLFVVPEKFLIIGRPRERGQINFNGQPLTYHIKKSEDSAVLFVLLLLEYLKQIKLIGANNLDSLAEVLSE